MARVRPGPLESTRGQIADANFHQEDRQLDDIPGESLEVKPVRHLAPRRWTAQRDVYEGSWRVEVIDLAEADHVPPSRGRYSR